MSSVAGATEFIVFGQLARVGVNGGAVKSPMSVVAVCGVVCDGVGVCMMARAAFALAATNRWESGKRCHGSIVVAEVCVAGGDGE